MVFSSTTFLFAFLPVTLILYYLANRFGKGNALLLAASLVFYAYGEPSYVLVLLLSAVANYLLGLLVAPECTHRKAALIAAVCFNLGILFICKYLGFLVSSLNAITGATFPVPQIPLPLGISFYTFQALSYVIDVYRKQTPPQQRLRRVLLYLALFPQLVAGPIVKYHDIDEQMEHRDVTAERAERGIRRFVCGLAKKVLVANTLAGVADALFVASAQLNAPGAWLAAISYTLQIYYDFSGYSDMAIGLGHLFGFTFLENFAHPYASTTIKEFWRRWHISLSTWFKDYLYIPLGGNRRGSLRTGLNKAVVFLLCGLWHGASWTFVVWGIVHGLFSLLEEVTPLRRLPRTLGHLYTMLVVTLAFVVFRADTFGQALQVLQAMLVGWDAQHMGASAARVLLWQQLTPTTLAALAVGVACALPVAPKVQAWAEATLQPGTQQLLLDGFALVAGIVCAATLASGTYNPFIYFRF